MPRVIPKPPVALSTKIADMLTVSIGRPVTVEIFQCGWLSGVTVRVSVVDCGELYSSEEFVSDATGSWDPFDSYLAAAAVAAHELKVFDQAPL